MRLPATVQPSIHIFEKPIPSVNVQVEETNPNRFNTKRQFFFFYRGTIRISNCPCRLKGYIVVVYRDIGKL